MTDQQQTAEAPETPPVEESTETQAPETPDLNAQLGEHFDKLGAQFSQQLQQLQQSWESQQQPQYDPYEEQDPYGGLDPNDPVHNQLIQTQQALQQMQQSQERFAQENWSRDLNALTERIPDLNKPEVAQPVVDQAKFIVQSMGGDPNGIIPIPLIEMAYGKYQADQIASRQQPVDQVQQGQAHLEGAGASPQQPQADPLDAIFPPEGQQQSSNIFGF